jgi:hypothetical protein
MAVKDRPVLEPRQLNEADRAVLSVLEQGRATPGYLEEQTEFDSTYVSQRLRRLEEHDHVRNVARGLWELVDDPRADADTDAGADPELEALRERVRELNAQLEAARQGDAEVPTDKLADARTFLNRALDALPEDVPGRTAAEDAKAVLEQVLDDD